MKKVIEYIVYASILTAIVLQIFILNKKPTSSIPENVVLQNAIFYNSFMFAIANDGNMMEDIQVYKGTEPPFRLFDSILSPTLLIYVPLSDETCSSCVIYAINSVKDFFDDFSENDRIILLANAADVRVNSRAYQKKVYHCVNADYKFEYVGNPENKPVFVVIFPNKQTSMFFTPNSLTHELTTRYLQMVKDRFFYE